MQRRRFVEMGQNWTSLILVYILLHSNEHLRFSFTYRTNPCTRQLSNSVQNSPYIHQHIPRKRLQASSCFRKKRGNRFSGSRGQNHRKLQVLRISTINLHRAGKLKCREKDRHFLLTEQVFSLSRLLQNSSSEI